MEEEMHAFLHKVTDMVRDIEAHVDAVCKSADVVYKKYEGILIEYEKLRGDLTKDKK